MKTLTSLLFTAIFAATAMPAIANTYMGLDIGKDSQTQVKEVLDKAKASYETDYGYKGYSDLAMYKINSYSAFSKYGTVDSAWLYFTPDYQLYKLTVTYRDAGSVHTLFRDALNNKYKTLRNSSGGFNASQIFGDGEVQITLARNTFGFGSDQKTTLTYEYQPSLDAVRKMEQRIQTIIASKNAEKAGDL